MLFYKCFRKFATLLINKKKFYENCISNRFAFTVDIPNVVDATDTLNRYTSSGKTVIMPYHLSRDYRVLVLVPRVVLTIESVNSVKTIFGKYAQVGFINGREKEPTYRLDYCTYGSALANKNLMERYDIIVVDEFHERSIDQDISLNVVESLYKAKKIKSYIISTATIGTDKIVNRYAVKHLHTEGRMYDVETSSINEYEIAEYVRNNSHRKGVIICNGKEAIETICRNHKNAAAYHAEMETEDLTESLKSNLIVGTNILRTGLNIEGLDYVIDFLQVNEVKWTDGVSTLVCRTATIAESNQAKGRVGRMSQGDYLMVGQPLGDYPEPEILKVPVLNGYLILKKFGYEPTDFVWLDTPNWKVAEIESVKHKFVEDGKITLLGNDFLSYNLPINLFLMVKESEIVGCLDNVLLAAAIMSASKKMITHKSSVHSVFNHKDFKALPNSQSEILDNILIFDWLSDNIKLPEEAEFIKENLFKGAYYEIRKTYNRLRYLYTEDDLKNLSYEKDEKEFKKLLYQFSSKRGAFVEGRRGKKFIESNGDYYTVDFKKNRIDKELPCGFTQMNLFGKEMATWSTTI